MMEGLGKSPILSVILANLANSIGLEGSDEFCVHKMCTLVGELILLSELF